MAWVEALQTGPSLTVNTVNRIVWNEATHAMMVYPKFIDLLYDAVNHNFALIGRVDFGAYQIYQNVDNTYHIQCVRALNQMGMKNLAVDYTVTPEILLVDAEGGEGHPNPVQTRENGIWAPVKP